MSGVTVNHLLAVKIGAHRGVDQVQEVAQNAVLIQTLHIGQCRLDRVACLGLQGLAVPGDIRIKAMFKQLNQQLCDGRIGDKAVDHVSL